ncbi:MAG: TetR/AcrR family transcriptional regulator [Deltaproteobacteria bacterium]|jgi:AcrR family transcriptional regulator|nr:TetR/AcrR family transcriptional regulator [Deltaproteobacteria bacterium]
MVEPAAAKPRDRESTERRILEAAIENFATIGFDASTTRQIAESASANEALIFRYFGGKDGLLKAIIDLFSSQTSMELCEKAPLAATRASELQQYFSHMRTECPMTQKMIRLAMDRAMVDPKAAEALRERYMLAQIPVLTNRLAGIKPEIPIERAKQMAQTAAAVSFSTLIIGRVVLHLPDSVIVETIESAIKSIAQDGKVKS